MPKRTRVLTEKARELQAEQLEFEPVAAFHALYSNLYGTRWPVLFAALGRSVRHVARMNAFAHPADVAHFTTSFAATLRERGLQLAAWPFADLCYEITAGGDGSPSSSDDVHDQFPTPPPVDQDGRMLYYLMDGASIFPPIMLNAQPGDRVLDMCAAPGGKTLVIAERLFNTQPVASAALGPTTNSVAVERTTDQKPDSEECSDGSSDDDAVLQYRGSIVANEVSLARRQRLQQVLKEYIPSPLFSRVTVTGINGEKWCQHNTTKFDRILVDAPCSSERHLVQDSNEMALWSSVRTKQNSRRQLKILSNALKACRKGGRIVYSTCSLSPFENDGVIMRILEKKGDCKVIPVSLPVGARSEYGWFILPDVCGYGPMYIAVLEKS